MNKHMSKTIVTLFSWSSGILCETQLPFTRCDFFWLRLHFLIKLQSYSVNSITDIHTTHSMLCKKHNRTQTKTHRVNESSQHIKRMIRQTYAFTSFLCRLDLHSCQRLFQILYLYLVKHLQDFPAVNISKTLMFDHYCNKVKFFIDHVLNGSVLRGRGDLGLIFQVSARIRAKFHHRLQYKLINNLVSKLHLLHSLKRKKSWNQKI